MSFSIDVRDKGGLRTLHFGSAWTQGAMRLERPWDLALEYTRVMMASLLLREVAGEAGGYAAAHLSQVPGEERDFPERVLLIGLGAGSLAKFLYRHCPMAHLTVVEIEPRVVEVARESFHLPVDPDRLDIVIGDGAEYVRTMNKTFDLILVDGFNERGHTGDLNTLPFYQACRARLSEQGVLAANLVGLSHGVKGGFAHIEAAFENRAMTLPRCKSGNIIAFAATGGRIELSLNALRLRALALEARTGLALLPIVNKLGDAACQDGKLGF